MSITPKSIPQITREQLIARLSQSPAIPSFAIDIDRVFLVGIRGYYRDTMGRKGVNDRGIYDDAMFLVGQDHFSTYNANTDPSSPFKKHLATLRTGLWFYKLGTHGLNRPAAQRYQALVQAAPVTVDRDGEKSETGYFGINIHRGSINSTSSAGCQTIVPAQWPAFIATVKDQLAREGQKTIPYALIL